MLVAMRTCVALFLAFLIGCVGQQAPTPTRTPAPSPSPTTRPGTPPEPTPPAAFRGELLFAERSDAAGTIVRAIALDGAGARTLATIPREHDARFALSPDGGTLAILEKIDDHEARQSRWWLRLVDVDGDGERELIAPGVATYEERPWDVGWSTGGVLLLASRPALERVSLADGDRERVTGFPADTQGVIFRPGPAATLLDARTTTHDHVYVLASDGTPRLLGSRALWGMAAFAPGPVRGEAAELRTAPDGAVTLALFGDRGERTWRLDGPRVDGHVELVGTTPDSVYLVWPVAADDPAGLGVVGTAFFFRFDLASLELELLDGTRFWTPFAPTGLAPDGSLLLVPIGTRPGTAARHEVTLCCQERPAPILLQAGFYDVIGWRAEH